MKRILLLSCCGPCSCAVIEKMAQDKQDVTVVFYNPNIRPQEEYQKRLFENKKVCKIYNIPFIDLEYDNDRWCSLTEGLQNEPERGNRCSICFHMRIKRVMEYALKNGYDAVASVLGASRYKNLEQVNAVADKASFETGVEYVHIEARKDGMQERRINLTKELDLYDQDYCGCKPR